MCGQGRASRRSGSARPLRFFLSPVALRDFCFVSFFNVARALLGRKSAYTPCTRRTRSIQHPFTPTSTPSASGTPSHASRPESIATSSQVARISWRHNKKKAGWGVGSSRSPQLSSRMMSEHSGKESSEHFGANAFVSFHGSRTARTSSSLALRRGAE